MHNRLFNFKTLPNIFCHFSQILIHGTCFILQILQQTRELLPLCAFKFSLGPNAPNLQQGNSFPYVHSKFSLVPNTPKFFNISHLFSTNYSYFAFSNITLFYVTVNFSPFTVILCQLPPLTTNKCGEDLTTAQPH